MIFELPTLELQITISCVQRAINFIVLWGILIVASTTQASADQLYSFQPTQLTESDFVQYPAQSSNGETRAEGNSWAPLNVSLDGGNSYSSVNVPESEFSNRTDQIDWKQISVSPDGRYVLAASARGNAGGYVYLADTSPLDGISIARFDNLGNANWTGAVFGATTSDLLVVDGVSTIWGQPANGENCDTETCIGSGEDGSNLAAGWESNGEHPYALAHVSTDRGLTWSERIQLPAFNRGVELTVTFQNSKFILRGTTTDEDGNPIVRFFELRDSRQRNQSNSDSTSRDREEEQQRRISVAQEEIVAKLRISQRPTVAEITKANFGSLSSLTANSFLDELSQRKPGVEMNMQIVQELASKWSSIESLMTQERPTINNLIQSGFVSRDFVGKASILRTLGSLPIQDRDSVDEIKAVIEKILTEKNARKERLTKRLSSI